MSDLFRIRVVTKFVEEIDHLSGGAFEQFAYKVMPLIQKGDWVERGTTIDGAPRKATVDTSLGAAAYVGEMSSTAGYFDGQLLKPKADLQHAFDVHPQVKHIWLLSSREAEAGQTTSIANATSAFLRAHPTVETATILDARQIAGHVFDHLGKHDLVRALSPFLPSLSRLAEEHAFSHSVPPIGSFIPRLALETRILARLASSSYVILQGMSGAGKTALAARIACSRKESFDNVIWHDSRELEGIEQLSSVAITCSGVSHNISSLLRHERILLVLDDPALPLSQLAEIDCGKNSKILVTMQVASGDHVIPIGDLEPQESRSVLMNEVTEDCPEDLVARVLGAVGGHPLMLHALNRLANEQGWNAVADCLETDGVGSLEDDRNQNIFRRVLRRQSESLSREMQFVRWCGSPRFHEELADVASSVALINLAKRGFLSPTTPGYARVHDLVYLAILAETVVSEVNSDSFRRRLTGFIRAKSDSDRSLLQRVSRVQCGLFKRLLSECREPGLVFMVALSRIGADSIQLLGDPVSDATTLVSRASLREASLEIRAIVETVEALFTLRTEYRPQGEATAMLEGEILALTSLLEHPGLSPEQHIMLEHHRAKMLVRLGHKDDAEVVFQTLLEKNPSFSVARIQLAKILPKKASVVECERLLAQHLAEPGTVSVNVVLEALRLLTVYGIDMAQYEELLMSSIEHAGGVDRSMAIRLVSSVAQRAWFTAPQIVLPMFKSIEWRDLAPALNEAFDWAQAHKYAAIEVRDDSALRHQLLNEALRAYKLAQPTKEYERTHYSEALILAGRYQDAMEQLDFVAVDKRTAFWWQRRAQALAGLTFSDEALAAIDKAIAILKDWSLLPVFRVDRFRIRLALGDVNATEDIATAIELLPIGNRFRQELEHEQALHLRV